MGKYEGSWSGMRRYLEHDMLAPCLYGRVRYGCTAYVGWTAPGYLKYASTEGQ